MSVGTQYQDLRTVLTTSDSCFLSSELDGFKRLTTSKKPLSYVWKSTWPNANCSLAILVSSGRIDHVRGYYVDIRLTDYSIWILRSTVRIRLARWRKRLNPLCGMDKGSLYPTIVHSNPNVSMAETLCLYAHSCWGKCISLLVVNMRASAGCLSRYPDNREFPRPFLLQCKSFLKDWLVTVPHQPTRITPPWPP